MVKNFNLKVFARAAILAALSIILTRFFSIMITQSIRIGLGTIPLMLSGMLFGPIVGAVTGFVTDILGVMINSQGAPFPGFTLSSILTGSIPGIVFMFTKFEKNKSKKNINKSVIISVLLIVGIVNIILNNLRISIMYATPFLVALVGKLPVNAIEIVVYFILLKVFFDRIEPKLKIK